MNPNEKAARRRDNAIAAGAVLAGGGVAAGGYGAIRGAKAVKSGVDDLKRTSSHLRDNVTQVAGKVNQTANRVGSQVQRTSEALRQTAGQVGGQVQKTGEAVRQNARRVGKAAGAPGRVVAKAGRVGGKVISKLKKFFRMQAELQATELAKIPLRGASLRTARTLAGLDGMDVAPKWLRQRHVMKPINVSDKKSLKQIDDQRVRIMDGASRSIAKWSKKNPKKTLENMPGRLHKRAEISDVVYDYLNHEKVKNYPSRALEAHRAEVTEFRASEVKKGTMMVDGILIDIRELEKIVAKKKVIQVPLRDVTGIARTKGLSKDRLRNVAGVMDKPGIITTDNVLIDGRHRARMRAASGIDFGLFRRATKADLKAAAVEPEELSAILRATTYFMATEDPSVKEEKKRKKQIRGIGRLLRLQFSAKETREERYARIYDNGDDLIKAGATGAATGGIVGGPVGAVIGGGASVAGQLKASRIGARKEEERKPIQGKIARNAIPAAMVAAGAGLATERGGKIMKKTKAIGRLVRKRLKNLEARIDSVTEFSKSRQWVVTEGEHKGSYEKTQKVLDGRVKPMVRDPNYDPKAFPGSAHSQPFKDDDTPIGINKQAWRASERKAKTAVKWGGRAKNAASDLADVVTGKPRKKDQAGRAKKREWEKSYAKNAIATGVAAGGIMAGNAYLRKNPQKRDALYGAADRATSGIIKKGKKLMAKAFSEGEPRPGMIELMTLTEGLGVLAAGGVAVGGAGMLARKALKKRKEKREKRELSEIRPGMIHEFVSVRDDSGRQVFRVEDARGNSARIHAGDKPKRERREKRWNEKIENERKLWGAGVAAGTIGGVVVGAKGKEIGKKVASSKLGQAVKSRLAPKLVPDTPVQAAAKKAVKTVKKRAVRKAVTAALPKNVVRFVS